MRNVYEHPELPDKLVKTIRPEIVNRLGFRTTDSQLKNMRPEGCYKIFVREITEYLIQCRKQYASRYKHPGLPIVHLFGVIHTNEGIGLVTEKISTGQGELAPTYHELKRSGKLRPEHLYALEDFLDHCYSLGIVFSDIHIKNIVYTETRTGRPECVCIDGFGEKSFVPIHRWSKRLNERKLDRIAIRLHRQLGVYQVQTAPKTAWAIFPRPRALLEYSLKKSLAYGSLILICGLMYFSVGTWLGSDQDDLNATEVLEQVKP